MASVASDSVWYVYGVVLNESNEGAHASASPPSGLDDADVRFERVGDLAALVSVLSGEQYGSESLESSTADVAWLSARAVAHDRVLTWASDRGAGAVVPLPMFSMFSGADAVRAMLRERAAQLAPLLERVRVGREFALRVYRVDAELLASMGQLSPRIGALEESAATASPGQRYLLERKIEGEKRAELRVVSEQLVDDIVAALAPHAEAVVRSPIARPGVGDASTGTMVLNAAFLVAHTRVTDFQHALTALVERYGGAHGLRFDFTGPWPPYHFVREHVDAG